MASLSVTYFSIICAIVNANRVLPRSINSFWLIDTKLNQTQKLKKLTWWCSKRPVVEENWRAEILEDLHRRWNRDTSTLSFGTITLYIFVRICDTHCLGFNQQRRTPRSSGVCASTILPISAVQHIQKPEFTVFFRCSGSDKYRLGCELIKNWIGSNRIRLDQI